jgi:hypothetical protein
MIEVRQGYIEKWPGQWIIMILMTHNTEAHSSIAVNTPYEVLREVAEATRRPRGR